MDGWGTRPLRWLSVLVPLCPLLWDSSRCSQRSQTRINHMQLTLHAYRNSNVSTVGHRASWQRALQTMNLLLERDNKGEKTKRCLCFIKNGFLNHRLFNNDDEVDAVCTFSRSSNSVTCTAYVLRCVPLCQNCFISEVGTDKRPHFFFWKQIVGSGQPWGSLKPARSES